MNIVRSINPVALQREAAKTIASGTIIKAIVNNCGSNCIRLNA